MKKKKKKKKKFNNKVATEAMSLVSLRQQARNHSQVLCGVLALEVSGNRLIACANRESRLRSSLVVVVCSLPLRFYGPSPLVKSSFCCSFVTVCEDTRRSRWEELNGIQPSFPYLCISGYGRSSIPLVALFPVQYQAFLEWLCRHTGSVWSAAVSLFVVVVDTMRQAFALEISTFQLR
jgi:hypothetical protein